MEYCGIENVLKNVNELFKEYEETKRANEELSEFATLLKEEIKIVQDIEKSAHSRKKLFKKCINQQKEVIQKLMGVKEDNEKLKQILSQVEQSLKEVQNNNAAEHLKKDDQMREVEQEYLKKFIKEKEIAEKQIEKIKSECSDSIDKLRTTISKSKETLDEKDALIESYQKELKNVKIRSAANIDTFHKKLAEQERKYHAEMEAWKIAELNFKTYQQTHNMNSVPLCETNQSYSYLPSQLQKQAQNHYEPGTNVFNSMSTNSSQNTPLTRQNIAPKLNNTNLVRPLTPVNNQQKNNEFVTVDEIFIDNQRSVHKNNEGTKTEHNIDKINSSSYLAAMQRPKIFVPNKKRRLFNNKH